MGVVSEEADVESDEAENDYEDYETILDKEYRIKIMKTCEEHVTEMLVKSMDECYNNMKIGLNPDGTSEGYCWEDIDCWETGQIVGVIVVPVIVIILVVILVIVVMIKRRGQRENTDNNLGF